MSEPVKASAAELVQISQQCHSFSEEVTGMLNGFSQEITYLLGGALQSPRVKEKLLEVQDQINTCKSKLDSTMKLVGDNFKASSDDYVAANEASEGLALQLAQYDGSDGSDAGLGAGAGLGVGAGAGGAAVGADKFDYTALANG
jgi:hypothetical protein